MIEAVLAGIFGLLIGSFLNVCIYRWPRDLSVVRPRSRCSACESPIAAFDNIPVLSYLLLRGKCRGCGAVIPWRYPVVEILTSVSFFYFALHFGLSLLLFKYCLLSAMLIGLVFADLETLILPDEFTIGGFFLGVALAFVVPVPDTTFQILTGLLHVPLNGVAANVGEALFGALLPAGSLWFGGWLFEKLRHKEGLGFGDVKMIAMVGSFLGLRGSLLTIILGSISGAVIGMAYIHLAKKDPAEYQLPFATFLGIGAFLAAIEGQRMLQWYVSTMWS